MPTSRLARELYHYFMVLAGSREMVKEEYPRSIGKRLLTTTDGGKHRDLGVSVGARTERTDVVLVGGGIMSATLGVFL